MQRCLLAEFDLMGGRLGDLDEGQSLAASHAADRSCKADLRGNDFNVNGNYFNTLCSAALVYFLCVVLTLLLQVESGYIIFLKTPPEIMRESIPE